MNEQFVNDLAVALRKVGTIHTVGEEWHSYTGEIPVGGVPYCGHMVTRTTYSALWAYAQERGLVKTEAEWQQLASANNGNVPYYSSGDGSTTFRMPKIVGYVRGASSQSESGSYVSEGLPNITGDITVYTSYDGSSNEANGAFTIEDGGGDGESYKFAYSRPKFVLDASRSNPIYGNSEHVTPETSVVMFGVYAFGAIVNSEVLDASALSTAIARIEASMVVNQKCNQTITINGYNTVDVTVSGLIPFKPVHIAVKNISAKGTIDVAVTSGSVLNADLSDSFVVPKTKNAVVWFTAIPSSTSMVVIVGDNSGNQVQSTVVAYQ